MRKSPVVLLASAALVAPTAVLAAAPAADAATLSVTNCSKTRYGVEVRIRIRDEGTRGIVRVSHPRGKWRFENHKVRRVASGVKYTSRLPGGGATMDAHGNDPVFRINTGRTGKTQVISAFKLRNGKTIKLTCTMR